MKLNRIGLNDFGIYQNEDVREIGEGVTIIAGPQRAGKTTFMKALRHLPYGITRGDDVPPASNQYDLFAEAEQGEKEFDIRLNGQAKPEASSNNYSVNLTDITGQIDKLQYNQLFTISLDQLKKLPEGIDDEKQLSEVLLGAAFGQIAEIPQIKDDFEDKANDIGLSKGNPAATTTDLNDPYKKIHDGLDKKKEALKQVNKYRSKKEQLEKISSQIKEVNQKVSNLEDNISRLGVIEEEFDQVRKLQEIESKWSDEQIENSKSFPVDDISEVERLKDDLKQLSGTTEAKQKFERMADVEEKPEYRESLLNNRKDIESLRQEISGWNNQLKNIKEKRSSLDAKEDEIKTTIENLSGDYEGKLSEVRNVDTDLVTKKEVSKAVEELDSAISDKKSHEQELEGINSQLDKIKEELEDLDENAIEVDKVNILKQISVISGVPLAILAGFSYAGYLIPGIIASAIVLGGLIYFKSDNFIPETSDSEGIGDLKGEKKRLEAEKEREENQKESAESREEKARDEVEKLVDEADVKGVEDPEAFETVYKEIVSLKEETEELEKEKSELSKSEKELDKNLQDAAASITGLGSITLGENLKENLDKIEHQIGELENKLEAAQDVQDEIDDKEQRKRRIQEIVNKTDLLPKLDKEDADKEFIDQALQFIELGEELDQASKDHKAAEDIRNRINSRFNRKRTVDLFEQFKEEDWSWISVLKEQTDQFTDEEDIQNEIENLETEKEKIEQARPEEKKRGDLRSALDSLSSDGEIMEAQEEIEEGSKGLQRLSEEYAVNRFAEKMADKLNQKFIEDIAGSLIEEAGEIFSQVTEEYGDLDHNNKIEDLQFEALKEGSSQEIGELSRATKEQLFMSLRIARIKQLDAKLPIVIDDSMTNFDPEHTGRMLEIIQQVAEENQVFILTCHPELIDIAEDKIEASNYYSLDEGHFKKHDSANKLNEKLEV